MLFENVIMNTFFTVPRVGAEALLLVELRVAVWATGITERRVTDLVDKTSKYLDRWSVRKLFRPSWPILAIGRTPHTEKLDRKVRTDPFHTTYSTFPWYPAGIIYPRYIHNIYII